MNIDMEKREELTVKYNSKVKKSELRLDELRTVDRKIEECLDDVDMFQRNVMQMLDHHRSELTQNNSCEDLELFNMVEEETHSNCRSTKNTLMEEKEGFERERKNIYKDREDINNEHKRSMHDLISSGESDGSA